MQSNNNRGEYKLLCRLRAGFISLACFPCLIFSAFPALAANEDLTEIPLEHLLSQEVITASKIARQISDSPSAVSIVTAQDIKSYGYRTLAEIINSMRGLNTVDDHVYTYISGRGFGRPGDYPGRIMLLIDGHQANDNLYNAVYMGNDGILDTELIERVEYVSGPGAASYGNGAFYGIINIVTKKGRDFDGAQVAFDFANSQTFKQRLTYGDRLDNGADFLLSVSRLRSRGEDLYFPEYDSAATNFGVAEDLDKDKNQRYFFKANYQAWTLESAFVTRKKDDPAASYGADFNVSPSYIADSNGYATLNYEDDVSRDLKQALKLYYGQYNFDAKAFYDGEFYSEKNTGRWWGTEAKYVYSGFDKHRLVYGLEYRNDYQEDFYLPTGDYEHSSYTVSAYLQDEYKWTDHLKFNLGLRGDYGSKDEKNLSPRLAAIYSPLHSLDIKLSYASAFRRPNPYEKYYTDESTLFPNPDLDKERVQARELVVEYRPDATSKLMSSLFYYTTDDLIQSENLPSPVGASRFTNISHGKSKGIDFEYEKRWSRSARLKASYAWQETMNNANQWLANSPKHLAKLNFTKGIFGNRVHAGVEVQYVGSRLTEEGAKLSPYTVTNLTVYSATLVKNTTISASIKNLFDRRYSVPSPTFYLQDRFIQDKRNFWLQVSYDFK